MKLNKGIALMQVKRYYFKETKTINFINQVLEPLNGSKLALVLLLYFLIPNLAFRTENPEGALTPIKNGFSSWTPLIKTACLWVSWTLVAIGLIRTFGLEALSGFEFEEFLTTLIKKIIYIGIFPFLFSTDQWLQVIFNSFSRLTTNINNDIDVRPNNIISTAINVVITILQSASIFSPVQSFFTVVSGIVTLVSFLLMTIDSLIVYLRFFLMNVIVFFVLASGGLSHFKQIGLNPIMTAIKVGVKPFTVQGLIGICFTTTGTVTNEINQSITIENILITLVTPVIFCIITKMIPGIIEAVFNGSIGGNTGAAVGFRAVATVAAGAAVGAAAEVVGITRAINAVKALHLTESGKGGMDLVRGVAKDLASVGAEHLRDNLTKGRMPSQMANHLREKLKDIQGKTGGGGISSEPSKEKSYQSGINPNVTK